jgi:hypothetical protein
LLDKPHYVLDRPEYAEPGKKLIYNGLIVSPSNNPVLKKCIDRIVKNVQSQEFGYNPLYPTGPGLLGEVLVNDPDIDLAFSKEAKYILWNKQKILEIYPEYRSEQKKLRSDNHYNDLWKQGNIYQP